MKINSVLSIFIFTILINLPLKAEVNKNDLNEFYDGCLDNAKKSDLYEEGLKICKCAINIINTQLTNEEFQEIFAGDEKITDTWMKENIVPNCNFKTS